MATAIEQQSIGLALWNSLVVSGLITASTVLFCTLAGFAFAKLRFRGRDALFAITLGTMMIPPSLERRPAVHDHGRRWAWPATSPRWSLPSLVHRVRRVLHAPVPAAQALPDELLEAARIDGATTLRTFWSVVLPIARPGMAVLGDAHLHDRLERLLLAAHRAQLAPTRPSRWR